LDWPFSVIAVMWWIPSNFIAFVFLRCLDRLLRYRRVISVWIGKSSRLERKAE
jgi:hypothetical protein